MKMLYAYAVAGAVITAVAVWAFLTFPGLLIWAAFVGWASMHHCGGDRAALKKTIVCTTFGVVMCWAVGMAVATGVTGLPAPIAAALAAGIAAATIVLVSSVPSLSATPAIFYGFASGFAFLSQTPGKFSVEAMTAPGLENVLIVVSVSLIIGALLGALHVKFGNAMMERQTTV